MPHQKCVKTSLCKCIGMTGSAYTNMHFVHGIHTSTKLKGKPGRKVKVRDAFKGSIFSTGGLAHLTHFNPTALRKTKIAYNFGLSECIRVNSV